MDDEADLILQVRDLVPDDFAGYGDNKDEYLFTDEQIARTLNGVGRSSVLRTAGFLCIAVGNSEALISKVIKTTDLTTNGAALQASWGARGEYYISRADAEGASADSAFFQIIDYGQGWAYERPELTEFGE